ncbi:outer membrane beta-barrel protein [Daejeonella sp.]|uniref:outer membrane beta-barrel protein n=1 Tax=Daejeonella sp. TaxID=2805397 RepID=UPI0025BA2ABA|nr:outer membrane beta-barrel protein [Daejeonella sp.]
MKRFTIFILLIFIISPLFAQNYLVKGMVQDSTGTPLTGTLIKLKWGKDSVATAVDLDGNFSFNNVKWTEFNLSAAFLGFETFMKTYKITSGNSLIIPTITLKTSSNTLNEVVISAITSIKIGEDTVSFNAAAYPVRQGDAVDEVLRKLPGVKVDVDGNVTNQGQAITKIRINGKDFFGTDVATAIKNLPADIIKNLQFIDDYGDQARLTGIKTGEPEKILNLIIQEDKKKGYSLRMSTGRGNEDRYNNYIRANTFKNDQQISFDGTINNSNTRGGGNGITTTKAFNTNYRNDWGKKYSADAAYSFSNRSNNTLTKTFTQNFLENFTRSENAFTNNSSLNLSHEFTGNLEYKPDTINYFKLSPRLTFNDNNSNNSGLYDIEQEALITERTNESGTDAKSLNLSTNLFYNHRFAKKGRSMSFRGNFNLSDGQNFRNVLNNYLITQNGKDSTRIQNQVIDNVNDNLSLWANISYMEPIAPKNFVELSYSRSYSNTNTTRETNDVLNSVSTFNPELSNDYEYSFTTNRFGLNYRFIEDKFNYTLGVNAQPALLEGRNLSRGIDTRNETFNIIPTARLSYKFSKQQALQVNYWGRNNQPGFLQLQPITDNSNLQNTVTGNPDLDPEFVHSFNARYNQSDWDKGHILYANIAFNQTQNKIVTTKVQVPNTINQVTSYINTNGFYTAQGDYSYGVPFAERKFTITYSGRGSFNNNVAFIDQAKNIAKNFVVQQELEFEVDIENVIDVELETSYSINTTKYSQESFTDRKTNTFQFVLRGRNYFFKDLTLGYDLRKTINSGFDNSIVRNPTILRLYTEYRFMKADVGAIRFEAFDIFNQNTGISRDVFDNIIIDRQVNRLGRYFMLSFNLRLNKFGGRSS